MRREPRVVAIGPGRGRTVKIDPLSTHLQVSGERGAALAHGVYRIAITYRLAPGPMAVEPHIAFSDPFRIFAD